MANLSGRADVKKTSTGPMPSKSFSFVNCNASSMPKINFFKRLKHKLNKGTVFGSLVSSDDLPLACQKQARENDAYKEALEILVAGFIDQIQRNPAFRRGVYTDCKNDTPPKQHGFEIADASFHSMSSCWKGTENFIDHLSIACQESAAICRDFEQKGRKACHAIRAYLNHELQDLEKIKAELKTDKETFDILTTDVQAGQVARKHELDKAKAKLDDTIAKWDAWQTSMVERKRVHKGDLVQMLREAEAFHAAMATSCGRLKILKQKKKKKDKERKKGTDDDKSGGKSPKKLEKMSREKDE